MRRTIYIFFCSNDKNLFGLTEVQDGSNLPADQCRGTWQSFKTIEISDADSNFFLSTLTPADVLQGIDSDGFFIIRQQVVFRERH